MTRGRQLQRCIFCGSEHISQEHLVSDWALRGYAKSRRPKLSAAHFIAEGIVAVGDVDPVVKAGVTCHECNGGWIKRIDDAAAVILKPVIRAEKAVELSSEQQIIVAAWIFKTALVCDAAQNGEKTELAPLRAQFHREQIAPPGCVIWAGPAAPPIAGKHRPFGVRPMRGTVAVRIVNAVGAHVGDVKAPIPGWLVMMGALDAILGGARMPPVTPESLTGFVQISPASKHVTVDPRRTVSVDSA